ncbi:MAG: hypothetical protein AB7H97_22495 [Pseudobdellovibrionaceae bacterium]
MAKFLILSACSLMAFPSQAHEGHDHGPGTVPSQKGGVMRSLETINLELVYKDKSIEIYPFSTEIDAKTPGKLKPMDISRYPVSATIELPKKKPAAIDLKPAGDHWAASFDAQEAHRFTLVLSIKQGGHQDKVKWTIEPKK